MKIQFFTNHSGRAPFYEFIGKLNAKTRARVLGCLKSISELGFMTPRANFRQIKGPLWEIKIRAADNSIRIFYAVLDRQKIMLLHAYLK